MKKITAFLVMLVCLFTLGLGLVSCDSGGGSGSSGGGGSTSVVGKWTATETEEGITAIITLDFRANSTYILSVTVMGYTETIESGTYSVSGNKITLSSPDGESSTGTINGNKMTFTGDGESIVFTKQ